MEDWIAGNWMAIYGAIVGTVALGLSFAKFRHSIKASQVSLEVFCEKSPDYNKNLTLFEETEESQPWDRPVLVELYSINVRNTGSVSAHIQSAGIVTIEGDRREALVRERNDNLILYPVSRSKQEPLVAKSHRKYAVYMKRGEPVIEASCGFVQDQTGKEWRSKA